MVEHWLCNWDKVELTVRTIKFINVLLSLRKFQRKSFFFLSLAWKRNNITMMKQWPLILENPLGRTNTVKSRGGFEYFHTCLRGRKVNSSLSLDFCSVCWQPAVIPAHSSGHNEYPALYKPIKAIFDIYI